MFIRSFAVVHGTKGMNSQVMVRKVQGTKRPSTE